MIGLSLLAYLKTAGRYLWWPVAKIFMLVRSQSIYRLTLFVYTFPNAVSTFLTGLTSLNLYNATLGTLIAASDTVGASLHKLSLSLDLYLGSKTVAEVTASPLFNQIPEFLTDLLSFNTNILSLYLISSVVATFFLYYWFWGFVVRKMSATNMADEHYLLATVALFSLILVYTFRYDLGTGYLTGLLGDLMDALGLLAESLQGANSGVGDEVLNESVGNSSTGFQ